VIVLFIGAWLNSGDVFWIAVALGACAIAVAARRAQDQRIAQMVLFASYLLLAISLATVFIGIRDSLHEALAEGGSRYARVLRIALVLTHAGALPALVLGLAWWLPETGTRGSGAVAALGVAACVVLAPHALERWTQVGYPPRRLAVFAAWRAAIPPGTTVLWPEDPPLDDWFALQRPAYWSLYQMAGMVFSRDDAMVGTSLESQVNPLLPAIRSATDNVTDQERPSQALQEICRLPDIAFVASWNDLGPTPYPTVSPDGSRQHRLYLYHCDPSQGRHASNTPLQ
jgi:hypothetical protein